jgi:hypothetical protein
MADLEALKSNICALAGQPPFIHAVWFAEHHLMIIEQLVNELCDKHPEANRTLCLAMVWVHDWGKILTNKGPDEDAVTLREIAQTLPRFGFQPYEITQLQKIYEEMETLTPHGRDFLPETKVISTADAVSHYIGPFFAIYFQEYHHLPLVELIAGNQKKIARDLQKILLPEILPFVQPRMQLVAEYLSTNRPPRWLS